MTLTLEVSATMRNGRKIIGRVIEKSVIKPKSIAMIPWYVLWLAMRLAEGAFVAVEEKEKDDD